MAERHKPVMSSRVEQQLIDRIDALVERTGVSRADVIERALGVGLKDQEDFVEELEGTVSGPLMALLMNEKFLNVVYALTGGELDRNQVKAAREVRAKKRRSVKGKLATR